MERVRGIGAQYYVVGKEVGDEGTPHLQGYLYFRTQRSFASMKKKLPGFHLEIRRGTHEQARDYCRKDGDFEEAGEEPEKCGGDKLSERIAKNQLLRSITIREAVDTGAIGILDVKRLKTARDILANENERKNAEDTRGVWIYGEPGAGKTHKARSQYGESFYVKAQNKWFDGYQGEKTIVLDDLDRQGACLGHYLKIWADKWACSGEVKGGTVPLVHENFVVTSNYHPDELWTEDNQMLLAIKRRFKIIHQIKL